MIEWENNTEINKGTFTPVAFVVLWGWNMKSAPNIKRSGWARLGERR